jgi:cytochrome c
MSLQRILCTGLVVNGLLFGMGWFAAERNPDFSFRSTPPARFCQQKNTPPEVRLLAPENNTTHPVNTLIPYTIAVSDAEDGESKFNEIATQEIFLEIRFEQGRNRRPPRGHVMQDPEGLRLIKGSDCFTCHQYKTKLIGPSFREIADRYIHTPSATALLADRIRKGASGAWGDVVMPAHSDLSSEEATTISQWILENGRNANLNYLAGAVGTFKLERPPGSRPGYFVLRATYTDKGLRKNRRDRLTGEQVIVLRYE